MNKSTVARYLDLAFTCVAIGILVGASILSLLLAYFSQS